ncbi:MAG: FecR domain-containing protein [Phycisphaeraceae bacterium]|nr:FecR domain-containing protein [Phycisphaeraceae bacterium]
MKYRPLIITCLLACFMTVGSLAIADDSPIDPTKTIADQKLTAVVTGVRGMVQIRLSEDAPWQKAKNGMELTQGAEFRTGPRSAVQFKIPPDQTITLDRLGTIKLLTAVAENNKIKTDLGMTYGRTRYDIRKAGFEHESTIRSPSATLSVRGTRVGIQDGASGFTAWSTQSRAYLFDQLRRQNFTFGENSNMDGQSNGPAAQMQRNGNVDPGDARGRDGDEIIVVRRQPAQPGPGQSHHQKPQDQTAPFSVDTFTQYQGVGDLRFELTWSAITSAGSLGADLVLTVLDPENYNNNVSTNPIATPFFGSTMMTTDIGGGTQVLVDTNLGFAGDAVSHLGPEPLAKEAIDFVGTFPLSHAVGVTNNFGGSTGQPYKVTLLKKTMTNPMGTELGNFSNSVLPNETNVHSLVITPNSTIIVNPSILILPNPVR